MRELYGYRGSTKDNIFGLMMFTYTYENTLILRLRKKTTLCGFLTSILETFISTVDLREW